MSMTEEMNWSPESDFVTEMSDGGVCIVKYTGPGGEARIPPTLGGWKVTEIGKHAFDAFPRLTAVEIPDSVKIIGDSAFRGCGLTSVYIPGGVKKISDAAFKDCPNVQLPMSVRLRMPGDRFFG